MPKPASHTTLAARSVENGHFRPDLSTAWVFCPVCRSRVEALVSPALTGPKVEAALKAAVRTHLDDEHSTDG